MEDAALQVNNGVLGVSACAGADTWLAGITGEPARCPDSGLDRATASHPEVQAKKGRKVLVGRGKYNFCS